MYTHYTTLNNTSSWIKKGLFQEIGMLVSEIQTFFETFKIDLDSIIKSEMIKRLLIINNLKNVIKSL